MWAAFYVIIAGNIQNKSPVQNALISYVVFLTVGGRFYKELTISTGKYQKNL